MTVDIDVVSCYGGWAHAHTVDDLTLCVASDEQEARFHCSLSDVFYLHSAIHSNEPVEIMVGTGSVVAVSPADRLLVEVNSAEFRQPRSQWLDEFEEVATTVCSEKDRYGDTVNKSYRLNKIVARVKDAGLSCPEVLTTAYENSR